MHNTYSLYYKTLKYLVDTAMKYRFIVAPNPAVGACLLQDETIVAEGYHTHFGEEHAEIACFKDAESKGIDPSECTLVITLEPCKHCGKTPPCVDAILKSRVRRVVIGVHDPNTMACGGRDILSSHGIEVIVLEDSQSQYCIESFKTWKEYEIPYIILKLATTIDGYIATHTHESQWLTNEGTRNRIHDLRASIGKGNGAIIVGAETVRYDNPRLYAHSDTDIPQPRPIIMSQSLIGLDNSFLVQQRAKECIIITTQEHNTSAIGNTLRSLGVTLITTGKKHILMEEALKILYKEYNIFFLLCEGGSILGNTLLSLPIPLELWHCTAPRIFADTRAIPMLQGHQTNTIKEGFSFVLQNIEIITNDILSIYTKIIDTLN